MEPISPLPNAHLDDATLRGLTKLAARADEIDALLDMLGRLIERGPQIAENLNDTVQDVRDANAGGDGLAEFSDQLPRLKALATPETAASALDAAEAVTSALSEPDVKAFLQSDLASSIATLGRLAGRLDELEALLNMLGSLIERGPEIAETLNDTVNQVRRDVMKDGGPLAAYGPTIDELKKFSTPERIQGLLRAGAVFQDAFESEGVQALLNSTVLDPAAVETIGELAQSIILATQEGSNQQPKITGPVTLVRAINDPYVSRALSFGLGVARAFGAQLAAADRQLGR
jgi:uncharacterized protein YjgD (DUF1641 family)